jgi:hypothetical protein
MVQRVGGIEIPAVYRNQQIYLPVQDIFDFLKLRCIPASSFDSVSGYFIDKEASFVVSKPRNQIVFSKRVFALNPEDLVRTETNLYLKSNYFGDVFGLDCAFNFRNLTVTLTTQVELPVIRDMRLEFMRSNISKMKGEVKADTVFPANRSLLRFGMADWGILSNQELGGANQTRLNLALGAAIAGGEASVALQHYVNEPFSEKQQHYLWRFVNNDHRALRQVMLGKIPGQSVSTIYDPVVGLQFTNAPTTYRRSFGKYTLSDYTEPDWAVELYVNNVLVDYVKADASGFFTFEVPLMYGNTSVMLRFYGPFGEERSKQQMISMPYNFLPAKEFQYTVSAGMVEDSTHSLFSRGSANYGVAKFMTVGGGMEYLSSVTSGSLLPFATTSLRLGSNLLFSGEYAHGVRGKGILNYRTAKNFQVELNYTRYDPDQTAVDFNFLEERKAMISFPIRSKHFSAFSRFSLAQNILATTQYSTAEWLLSGVLFGVSTNFTTYALVADLANPYVYSNLSLAFRLPGKLLFRPQAQFVYTGMDWMLVKAELEKQFLRNGFLNLSYEKNFRTQVQSIQFGFRYDFSFAQTGFSFRKSNDMNTFFESARGSLLFDRKTKYVGASNRTSVGRGGIVIVPFLDMDANGRRDPGESKVLGLKIKINGGRVEQSKRDSVVRVFDLEPYVSHFIELDRYSFENIAWQIRLKNMSVVVDPNQFKLVEIPISVLGEVSGMVNLRSTQGDKGLGRIVVNFYRSDGAFVTTTMTEPDGYFSFLGLLPDRYIARIDTAQMRKLHMTAIPAEIPFTITKSSDGDVVGGLEFFVKPDAQVKSPADLRTKEVPVVKTPDQPAEVPVKNVEKVVEPDRKILEDLKTSEVRKKAEELKKVGEQVKAEVVYCIQIAASKAPLVPAELKAKGNYSGEVFYFQKDGWYKYVLGKYPTLKEATSEMTRMGISGFVTKLDPAQLQR